LTAITQKLIIKKHATQIKIFDIFTVIQLNKS